MEKIGVISDIHGNLDALKVILPKLVELGCKEIIHTGDVADIGPQARECFELLKKYNVLCLTGNHDRDFVKNQSVHKPMSHVSQAHKQYVFSSLDGLQTEFAEFPYYVTRICGGKKIVFEHYCREADYLTAKYPFKPLDPHPTAEKFDEMYAEYDCDAAFFGHKHEPCDIVGKKLYVDVGSVGCHEFPMATAIVIQFDQTHFDYQRIAVPYDFDSLAHKMTDGTLPDGEYLLKFYFLHTIKD